MKKIINFLFGIITYLLIMFVFIGYNHEKTHVELNTVIVSKFLANASSTAFAGDKFKNYEFKWNSSDAPNLSGPALSQEYYLSYSEADEQTKSFNPEQWISEGGWMEDEPWGPASLSHFYDPIAIDGGKKHLSDNSGKIETVLSSIKEWLSIDAKSWAMSDNNRYSWKKAKEYVILALKAETEELKNGYMAKAYRSLGQTLHLIADMGCPPHVRNDSHPPQFPMEGFAFIGDPDPYEQLCKSIDAVQYANSGAPNPNLKTQFVTSETYSNIFEKLSFFTNGRFYTNQTIVTDRYNPVIRPDNPYPNPSVGEADYNKSEYTYYKNYDGVNVKMCKDKRALPFGVIFGTDSVRGSPYIDFDCVKSIARAIMPNIAEAGANVVRVFVPSLEIEIEEAKIDSGGIIRGKISYTIPSLSDEYSGHFDLTNLYNGPVKILINNNAYEAEGTAIKNEFEIKLEGNFSALKKGDDVKASFEFGGIVVKSENKKFEGDGPTISSIVPSAARVGDQISIYGTAFGAAMGTSSVWFNGAAATEIVSWTDTKIEVKVPVGAETGDLYVRVNNLESNKVLFTVASSEPVITSIYPEAAQIGDTLMILGINYGTDPTKGTVFFNDISATEIISWTDIKIEVKIPDGALTGYIKVKINELYSNEHPFVIGPFISTIVPGSATVGTEVEITGLNFGQSSSGSFIEFNNVVAQFSDIISWSVSKIKVKVPVGATSGYVNISVLSNLSNLYWFDVLSDQIIVDSVINTKHRTNWGFPGESITILGSNFGSDPGTVTFNGVDAVTEAWNETYMRVYPPDGITNLSDVIVTTSDNLSSEAIPYFVGVPLSFLQSKIEVYAAVDLWVSYTRVDNGNQGYVPFIGFYGATVTGTWQGSTLTIDMNETYPNKTGTIKSTFSNDGLTLLRVEMSYTNSDPYPAEIVNWVAEYIPVARVSYSNGDWGVEVRTNQVQNFTTSINGSIVYVHPGPRVNIEGLSSSASYHHYWLRIMD